MAQVLCNPIKDAVSAVDHAQRIALPKTPILLTTATPWETRPLAGALKLKSTDGGRYEGIVGGRRVTLIKTGIGASATTAALNGVNDNGWLLVISAGLCGSMQKDVRHGDIVADVRETELEFVSPLKETATALALPFHFGKILHTNIVLKPAAKRALGSEQRVIACDMETAAVRRWADGKFHAIAVRVVLDDLDEELPSDAPEGTSVATLSRFALTHASSLPSLMRIGWRSSRAMKILSRYLAAYLGSL